MVAPRYSDGTGFVGVCVVRLSLDVGGLTVDWTSEVPSVRWPRSEFSFLTEDKLNASISTVGRLPGEMEDGTTPDGHTAETACDLVFLGADDGNRTRVLSLGS